MAERTRTERLGLIVPQGNENVMRQDLVDNLEDIDDKVALQTEVDMHIGNGNIHTTQAEKTKLTGIEPGAQVNTVTSVAGKTGNVTITKSDVGLSNVDNVKQATKTEHDILSQKVDDNEQEFNEHLAERVSDGVHGMGSIASQEYEEGSFTPDLRFAGNNEGITYTSQQGRYIKIGNLVYFEIQIVLTNKGSSNGEATIGGLPFVSRNSSPERSYVVSYPRQISLPSDTVTLSCRHRINSPTLELIATKGTNVEIDQAITDEAFINTSRIYVTGQYPI